MGSGFAVGYINSAVILLLLTGWAMLRIDVKGYELSGMIKEKKASRIMGWLNITLGIATYIGHWIFKSMT